MTTVRFADVAVRARIFDLRQSPLTYHVPDHLQPLVAPGSLVWVPLRQKQVQGVVLALRDLPATEPDPSTATAGFTIRPIEAIGDPAVVIPPAQLELARFVAQRYRAPLWEAIALLLPAGVLQESFQTWRASPRGLEAELGELPPGEREMLFFLRRHGEHSEQALADVLRGTPAELRKLLQALAERGLVYRGTALSRPSVRVKHERLVRLLLAPAEHEAALQQLARAPQQRQLLETLIARAGDAPGGVDQEVPAQDLPLPRLRQLEARGWIALGERELLRNPLDGSPIERDMPPPLTSEQAAALQPVLEALDSRSHAVFLLHGITGSGKTELYLRAIARTLRQERQALVLVPEIALTAQLVRRFAARFGGDVAILHSALSLGERYDTWRRLRRGEAKIVVGSRSTVFAPLPQLGLVIVDEEHESSYKHAEGVRYQARDLAVRLGDLASCPVVLGSATPALESYQAVREGHYRLLELRERVAARAGRGSRSIPLPPVRIVDMRVELRSGNRSLFSRALQQALQKTLRADQQAILFLNRRGAASIVLCRDCGYVVQCVRCSSPLVLHRLDWHAAGLPVSGGEQTSGGASADDTIMRCHTCGYRELPPVQCPNCWSTRIRHFGVGTQRVVEEMATLFPEARVLRWDRDVTARKGSHDRLLDAFTNHEADVVVGTQMIAKGLDLPLVTLVGIVSAEIGLHLPDFRAGERTFQLLAQVAGRAGRRELGGQVVLQSYTPDHYALQAAAAHDYQAFFQEEIAFRREAAYPPFSRLVRFVYAAANEAQARGAAETLAAEVEAAIARLELPDSGVIGPAPAFAERVRDRYRWHLLLRAPDPQPVLDALGPLPGWTVDVDPVSML